MQMINVLKRLAELDANNPNVVQESLDQPVDECGDSMGAMQSHSPASISMTAGSGEELSSLLKTLMSLSGESNGEEPVSAMPAPAEPEVDGDVLSPQEPEGDSMIMRSMIDKMNDVDDGEDNEYSDDQELSDGKKVPIPGIEKSGPGYDTYRHIGDNPTPDYDLAVKRYGSSGKNTHRTSIPNVRAGGRLDSTGDTSQFGEEKVDEWDNEGNDPNNLCAFNANQHADRSEQSGPAGGGEGRHSFNQPVSKTYEALMRDYREFVAESKKK